MTVLSPPHVSANDTSKPKQQTWELFNITDDPSETNDVKEDQPEIFNKLQAKLADFSDAAVPPNIASNRAPQGFNVPKVWGESN